MGSLTSSLTQLSISLPDRCLTLAAIALLVKLEMSTLGHQTMMEALRNRSLCWAL